MNCPYCDFAGPRPELHAHLTDTHPEACATYEEWGNRYYQLACPWCDHSIMRKVKPRLNDPTFLEEYAREIRIVAFDMFLYHLEETHEQEGASA
jgi:DNA-directed RNA polymerase subunit RPC12/RpoP